MAIELVPETRQTGTDASPRRRYLMCPPEFFDVEYAINPWMRPERPVNRTLAMRQWTDLVATYERLGHTVEVIDPEPGLPDMVFAANSGTAIDGRVLLGRFRHEQRRGEEVLYRRWFEDAGYVVTPSTWSNEGEGDFALVADVLLAASGFRTDRAAHTQAGEVLARRVVSLDLVDPRFYHLDTALAVLADGRIAYYPPAFSRASRTLLEAMFPDAIIATARDAGVLGLNATSDGRNVVLPAQADDLADAFDRAGYDPVPVDLSELLKAGGSVKCCTLELRDATTSARKGTTR